MELRTRLLRLTCVAWCVWLSGCIVRVVTTGSGGLGAMSSGVAEWIVEGVIGLVVLLVLFGGWKLAKIILAAMSH